MNTFNGRYYTDDDIQHRIEIIKILEFENRLAGEYLNKEITQEDVDFLGVRNFQDALTLISKNSAILTQYKEVVNHFTTPGHLH